MHGLETGWVGPPIAGVVIMVSYSIVGNRLSDGWSSAPVPGPFDPDGPKVSRQPDDEE